MLDVLKKNLWRQWIHQYDWKISLIEDELVKKQESYWDKINSFERDLFILLYRTEKLQIKTLQDYLNNASANNIIEDICSYKHLFSKKQLLHVQKSYEDENKKLDLNKFDKMSNFEKNKELQERLSSNMEELNVTYNNMLFLSFSVQARALLEWLLLYLWEYFHNSKTDDLKSMINSIFIRDFVGEDQDLNIFAHNIRESWNQIHPKMNWLLNWTYKNEKAYYKNILDKLYYIVDQIPSIENKINQKQKEKQLEIGHLIIHNEQLKNVYENLKNQNLSNSEILDKLRLLASSDTDLNDIELNKIKNIYLEYWYNQFEATLNAKSLVQIKKFDDKSKSSIKQMLSSWMSPIDSLEEYKAKQWIANKIEQEWNLQNKKQIEDVLRICKDIRHYNFRERRQEIESLYKFWDSQNDKEWISTYNERYNSTKLSYYWIMEQKDALEYIRIKKKFLSLDIIKMIDIDLEKWLTHTDIVNKYLWWIEVMKIILPTKRLLFDIFSM